MTHDDVLLIVRALQDIDDALRLTLRLILLCLGFISALMAMSAWRR